MRRVIEKLQRAQTCKWVVWQLKIFLSALVNFGNQTCQCLFPISNVSHMSSGFMFCIKKHLVVIGKEICRPFCSVDQQGETLQVSKDMMTTAMSAGLIFFQPCLWKQKKKKTKPKPTPTYFSFFLNIQTGPNIDILFINLIVTKTVHYKQYRNKLKGMCHTSWLIFYTQFKNTAYSLIVHSYCVDRVHH